MLAAEVEAKSYEINIHGHKFSVSSAYDQEHIQKVESFLNQRMDEVSKQVDIVSPTKLAVLVALNLADELVASKSQNTNHSVQFEECIAALCQKLDEALANYNKNQA